MNNAKEKTVDPYNHEDAFKAANLCAGRMVDIGTALKGAESDLHAKAIIGMGQDIYKRIFDAFIEGVDYGRKNPAESEGTLTVDPSTEFASDD